MPADRSSIDVRIRLVDAAKFDRDAKRVKEDVKGIGDSTEKTGKQSSGALTKMAKWAATSYLFKRAAGFLKEAVSETTNLAKASIQMQRLTGMDVDVSSRWIVLAEQRGVQSQRLQVMFTQLGRAQQRALAGSAPAVRSFQALGVSMDDLRSSDASELLLRLSDAISGMPNGLQKAAVAQQFFGRTGRQLLPLLNMGSTALQGQLDMVEKYGAGLEGKTASQVQGMIQRQREMDLAMRGVKEQLADALIPALTAVAPVLTDIARSMAPILKNGTVMRVIVLSLAIAWAAYTAATIAGTFATLKLRTALISTGVGAAIVLLSIALLLLVEHWDAVKNAMRTAAAFVRQHIVLFGVLALMLFGVVGLAVLLIVTHFDQFKAAIFATWAVIRQLFDWVKSHWRLLAFLFGGPFGIAAIAIANHFDTIRHAAHTLWHAITVVFHAIGAVVSAVADAIGAAVDKIKGPVGWVADTVGGFLGGVADVSNAALSGAAAGGTVTSSGALLVGERGPEVVHLPRHAQIVPLDRAARARGGGGGGVTEITVPLYLDGREVTRAVAKHTADAEARR